MRTAHSARRLAADHGALTAFLWSTHSLKSSIGKCTLPHPHHRLTQPKSRNVGFLRYFRPEQIPNFALALPILSLYFGASWTYYSANWPAWFWRTFRCPAADRPTQDSQHAFLCMAVLPHIHLHTLLALQLLFFSHVQIALRQAVTNPVLFWFLGYLCEAGQGDGSMGKKAARWSMLWTIASVTLWTAFYPPA
jgi:phosphatidylinositol glycan class V